jgi:hypothetical protein
MCHNMCRASICHNMYALHIQQRSVHVRMYPRCHVHMCVHMCVCVPSMPCAHVCVCTLYNVCVCTLDAMCTCTHVPSITCVCVYAL